MIALPVERPPRVRSWLFIAGVVLLSAISFTPARAIPLPRASGPDAAVSLIATPDASSSVVSSAPSPATLAISAAPGGICAFAVTNCPAGTGVAQVNLSVTIQKPHGWSDVQVAFVMDTTPFMGVFDPTKGNISGESNAVPFLVQNATEIATAIQAAHPQSNVSFALVDYFST